MRVGSGWKRRASTLLPLDLFSGIPGRGSNQICRALSAAVGRARSGSPGGPFAQGDAPNLWRSKRDRPGSLPVVGDTPHDIVTRVASRARCQPDHPAYVLPARRASALVRALGQWTVDPPAAPREAGSTRNANGYSAAIARPGASHTANQMPLPGQRCTRRVAVAAQPPKYPCPPAQPTAQCHRRAVPCPPSRKQHCGRRSCCATGPRSRHFSEPSRLPWAVAKPRMRHQSQRRK